MKRKPVILIGYRRTGKTTAAREVAGRLGLPAKDSDREIENRAGQTIADIFAQDGENAFRDLEESVIADVLRPGELLVLATGGGAILRSSTRELLRRTGTVFWLTASPDILLKRIAADTCSQTTRPPLTTLPMRDEIIRVLESRTPLYQSASHHTISTDSATPAEIARQIIALAAARGQSQKEV